MDVIIGLIISAIILIVNTFQKVDIIISLMVVLCIFLIISKRKGFTIIEILKMAYKGGKKSFLVLQIFILIGAIISSWIAAGTVPAIVYYGIKFINPHLFIISAFILSSLVSLLIGTSFGTIGTVGISLMVMARAGNANLYAVGGAIISGAYLGDRCSPMSSSANLIANLTNTELYINIKNMLKTSIIPVLLTVLLYTVLSLLQPLNYTNSNIIDILTEYFSVEFIVIIPAIVIMILSIFKVKVKTSMYISMASAAAIAYFIQHYTLIDILKILILGFKFPSGNPLYHIIKGGGVLSMIKLSLVVFMSSALTGIFEGANLLSFLDGAFNKIKTHDKLFLVTIISSIISAMVGCTQVLAVMLTNMTVKKLYENNGLNNYNLALDLENTAIVIAPLIPWNVAILVPLTNLEVGAKAIFYSFYLILVTVINLIVIIINVRKNSLKSSVNSIEKLWKSKATHF